MEMIWALRSERGRIGLGRWSVLAWALCVCFAGVQAFGQATVTCRSYNRPYSMTMYSGPSAAATFSAPSQLALPGQQPNETSTFWFWEIDGELSFDPSVTTEAGFVRATAWYQTGAPCPNCPQPPASVTLLAYDLIAGDWITSPSNVLVASTSPGLFLNKCHSVPCSFAVEDQASGSTISSLTAESGLTGIAGDSLSFKHWLVGGTLQNSATLSVPASGMFAVAYYGEPELYIPPPPHFNLHLLHQLGLNAIPRICLYVSSVAGCPGCGPNELCGFDLIDIWGYEVELIDEEEHVLAKGEEIKPGVMRLRLTPELVKSAGGMDQIGLRFRPVGERPRASDVRVKMLQGWDGR